MTRALEKKRERFFVEEAAKLLDKAWTLGPDQEAPDFLVTEGAHQFGLEVCNIFMGSHSKTGSAMKKGESDVQRCVEALRREYEEKTNIPLSVKFVGDMCVENLTTVVPALFAKQLASKPVGHHDVIDTDNGLRVHVTVAFRADWFSVNDRVGWVDRDPIKYITTEIEKKSKKLQSYKKTAGSDIRLLIVADRIHNSGKLMLGEQPVLGLGGFQVVYFFSYPESVTIFDCATIA
ncbi:MAG: hypothetical protein QOJ96_862 [Alphaproteobacteria bacterium]|jgi:8-oxo-dGTP pyrophosphatase MutT (NUDIX family)|nr:hypothetical protein [Alphaproteobacteria bacterium]